MNSRRRRRWRKRLLSVLLVGDFFHPVDNFAVAFFLNGDVRHGSCRRRAMPMLLAGREPDNVTGPDLFDRTAPALRPATAGHNDESLTERMHVPCSMRARLEGYARALHQRRIGCLK